MRRVFFVCSAWTHHPHMCVCLIWPRVLLRLLRAGRRFFPIIILFSFFSTSVCMCVCALLVSDLPVFRFDGDFLCAVGSCCCRPSSLPLVTSSWCPSVHLARAHTHTPYSPRMQWCWWFVVVVAIAGTMDITRKSSQTRTMCGEQEKRI